MVSDAIIKGKAQGVTAPQAFAATQILEGRGEALHARLNSLSERGEFDDASLRRIANAALDMLREAHVALEDAHRQIGTQRARIEHLEAAATTDDLTGLANRRGFVEAFDRELDRTTRGLTKGGLLLMIDLDNFKLINDTYGHAAGDAALRLVAETLKGTIRRMDVAARLGGDEFVLLFSNADTMAAVDRAQQLAMRLNTLTLRWKGEKINVRASIGMRAYAAGDSVDTALHGADSSMYAIKAKRAARKEAKTERARA
ncbi:MAG: GGDEF domain-containing protein [Rhodospirillales bacterium]|nr:GGDEF domain-containing protein [Alphaproteobacteria bacterium]MCB9986956.1 GGDEF domain-containing protein [Rhodospirillales bacterium]USO08269.1 MAG: GGDEF domain-containing protein [Rhodospirillales bacterium]